MGEIPSLPTFRVKRWFAFAILASASIRMFGEVPQTPSAQNPVNPPKQTSAPAAAPERRALSLDPLPAEEKADILMARGEYAAAIIAYQEGNLKSATVWNSIGMAYHHMFALEQARRAYQTALSDQSSLCRSFQ